MSHGRNHLEEAATFLAAGRSAGGATEPLYIAEARLAYDRAMAEANSIRILLVAKEAEMLRQAELRQEAAE